MTWFTEDLSISTYWSVSFQLSIKFGHGNLLIHKCKVSHFKHSGEKFILYYKCSYNMKCWHDKFFTTGCWQFNSWIANTFTFYKYLYMLVVLLVLARCWQINWPQIPTVVRNNELLWKKSGKTFMSNYSLSACKKKVREMAPTQ